jgi:hypothetical protein
MLLENLTDYIIIISGQEQDLRSRQGREVSPPRYLGQGDPHARQRRIRPRQVHQEPAASGHGQKSSRHDVPIKDLKTLFVWIALQEKYITASTCRFFLFLSCTCSCRSSSV